MAMDAVYRNLVADAGAAAITHIGLVDGAGSELTGGTPAYARRSVAWTAASDGTIRPTMNLTFDVPAGVTVAGWRGYSDSSGGINYGGESLTPEAFAQQGEYTLLAAGTGVLHQDVS